MTRESEMKAILIADIPLMALLTGGVWTQEEVGVEGFHRGEKSKTADAFNEDGDLLPGVLIRQGSVLPYGNIRSQDGSFMAQSQVVTLIYFEMRGHAIIDLAKQRVYDLVAGQPLGRSYPIWLAGEGEPQPDTGPLLNSTTLLQDWMVVSTRVAVAA